MRSTKRKAASSAVGARGETGIVSDALKLLNYLHGVTAYRNNTGGWGRVRYGLGKGSPDIVACILGQFVAFEAKTKDGKVSADQLVWAEAFRMSGGQYFVFTSAEQAYSIALKVLWEREAA